MAELRERPVVAPTGWSAVVLCRFLIVTDQIHLESPSGSGDLFIAQNTQHWVCRLPIPGSSAAGRTSATKSPPVKVLIADDSPIMRALLRALCAGLASEIRDCIDGEEAIATFEEFRPDWTVMDIAMPGVDGLTATKRITRANPGARVVVITQQPSPEYELAAREAGACTYLVKENLPQLPGILSRSVPASWPTAS
jgi:CheY-like chemotaxis protein